MTKQDAQWALYQKLAQQAKQAQARGDIDARDKLRIKAQQAFSRSLAR